MAGTNYVINPVKATCIKYSGRENAIQGMNDTCFNICAAFSGSSDIYSIDPQCAKSCTDFIEKKKHEIFGVGSCDHQVPYRPVAWRQVPHFVPKLLQKGMNVEEARAVCKNMCSKSASLLTAECMENCDTDANAVESYQQPTPPSPPPKPQPISKSSAPQKKKNHTVLILSILSLSIIVILLALLMIRKQ